jgi:hypothetical protein
VRRSGGAVLWTGIGCAALVLVPTALAVGSWSPAAGAAQAREHHSASPSASSDFQVLPVQKGNAFCGANDTRLPVVGRVNLIRDATRLYVGVGIANLRPDSTYYIFLYAQGCDYLGAIGTLRTNASGGASGKFSADFPSEYTGAFVDPYNPTTGSNDTPYVTLPY